MIKGIQSKHLESIALVEQNLKGSGKIEIFMFRQADQQEVNGEWKDYTFIVDKWNYTSNNHKGDEPIIIRGFMCQNYVNDIFIDSGSSIDVMYNHFYK